MDGPLVQISPLVIYVRLSPEDYRHAYEYMMEDSNDEHLRIDDSLSYRVCYLYEGDCTMFGDCTIFARTIPLFFWVGEDPLRVKILGTRHDSAADYRAVLDDFVEALKAFNRNYDREIRRMTDEHERFSKKSHEYSNAEMAYLKRYHPEYHSLVRENERGCRDVDEGMALVEYDLYSEEFPQGVDIYNYYVDDAGLRDEEALIKHYSLSDFYLKQAAEEFLLGRPEELALSHIIITYPSVGKVRGYRPRVTIMLVLPDYRCFDLTSIINKADSLSLYLLILLLSRGKHKGLAIDMLHYKEGYELFHQVMGKAVEEYEEARFFPYDEKGFESQVNNDKKRSYEELQRDIAKDRANYLKQGKALNQAISDISTMIKRAFPADQLLQDLLMPRRLREHLPNHPQDDFSDVLYTRAGKLGIIFNEVVLDDEQGDTYETLKSVAEADFEYLPKTH